MGMSFTKWPIDHDSESKDDGWDRFSHSAFAFTLMSVHTSKRANRESVVMLL